jgi:hypothetical protein
MFKFKASKERVESMGVICQTRPEMLEMESLTDILPIDTDFRYRSGHKHRGLRHSPYIYISAFLQVICNTRLLWFSNSGGEIRPQNLSSESVGLPVYVRRIYSPMGLTIFGLHNAHLSPCLSLSSGSGTYNCVMSNQTHNGVGRTRHDKGPGSTFELNSAGKGGVVLGR